MELPEKLLQETIRRFPHFPWKTPAVYPLEKGGSDRSFYRISINERQSLVLISYQKTRQENEHYAPLATFLRSLGIRVPRIYAHQPDQGILWMEDLGDLDLCACRSLPWPRKSALYRQALQEIFLLHTHKNPQLPDLPLAPPFTRALYLWEQSYFFENCLGRFFGQKPQTLQKLAQHPRLHAIADKLGALPRCLVHRDFQSRNILVRRGRTYLIDFQGLRWGLASYDLASLLFDPYVALLPKERSELKAYYEALWEVQGQSLPEDLESLFDWVALQRLMQALGAFGYLGLVRGKKEFLAYIPVGIQLLVEVLERIEGLETLLSLVKECCHKLPSPHSPAARPPSRSCPLLTQRDP